MRELVGGKNTIGRTAAVLKSHIKRPLSLPFYKNTQISNLMKIRPVEAELFHAEDKRADRHGEANSRFSQFCESA